MIKKSEVKTKLDQKAKVAIDTKLTKKKSSANRKKAEGSQTQS